MIFLDIETVPEYYDITQAPAEYFERWHKFYGARNRDLTVAEITADYATNAALYAEFGKICTICCALDDGIPVVQTMGEEVQLLQWLFNTIEETVNQIIVAHNGRPFDFPFIVKRALINQLIMPKQFRVFNVKPWERLWLDTNDMWVSGNWERITLDLICFKLGIPSPKEATDTDGSDVRELFYSGQKDLLDAYCKADVVAVRKVYNRLKEVDMYTVL